MIRGPICGFEMEIASEVLGETLWGVVPMGCCVGAGIVPFVMFARWREFGEFGLNVIWRFGGLVSQLRAGRGMVGVAHLDCCFEDVRAD